MVQNVDWDCRILELGAKNSSVGHSHVLETSSSGVGLSWELGIFGVRTAEEDDKLGGSEEYRHMVSGLGGSHGSGSD